MSAANLPHQGLPGVLDLLHTYARARSQAGPRRAGEHEAPGARTVDTVLLKLETSEQAELEARERAVAVQGLVRRFAADLLSLSPEDWASLSVIRADFAKAAGENDTEAIAELIGYVVEILSGPTTEDDFVDEIVYSDPEELAVIERVDREREAFFVRYFELKAASGLSTQADVAKAAGLSPTTVHAIESRSVWPQFKTLKKLADAFGVEVSAFSESRTPDRPKRSRKTGG